MKAHAADRLRAGDYSLVEPLEGRLLFARVEGLDVSVFQGAINWNTVAANNKQFVFIRASRSNLDLDTNFHANVAGATAAGLLAGPYHRALPLGTSDAGTFMDPIEDARRFVTAAGSIMTTGFLRPVLDIEDGFTLGREQLSQWVLNFLNEVERLTGVEPIVYANTNYATNFLSEEIADKYELWIARYNGGNDPNTVDPQVTQPETPAGFPNPYGVWNEPVGGPPSHDSWSFWQYTSRADGLGLGVSSIGLDLNLFNGTLDEMKENFLIGFQKNYPEGRSPFAVGPDIMAIIPAEDYDIGGADVSYADTTAALNDGGVYRVSVREGVDLASVGGLGSTNFRVTNTFPGEFVEYTFDVAATDDYRLSYFVSQTEPGATFHVEIDGQALPTLTAPATGGFDTLAAVTQDTPLAAGRHVMRVSFDSAAGNGRVADVDRIEIAAAPEPPPPPLPPPAPDGLTGSATYVRGGLFARQNFGSAPQLLVQRGRGSANTSLSYLKFDLTDVDAISSATLRLTGQLSGDSSQAVKTNVYSAKKSRIPFDEGTVSFKKRPGPRKLLGSISVSGTEPGTYELDLTSFLQAELAAGRREVTLVLRNVTRSILPTVFSSDDSDSPPVLVIE